MLSPYLMKQTKDTCKYDYDDKLIIIAQANRYKLYLTGLAYIPYKNLSRYKKSFNLIYRKNV